MSWRNVLSYFMNISRSTEQLCYFVPIALVWLISPVVQTTWTPPRLQMGTSRSSPTNSINVLVSLVLGSATLGSDLRGSLTSTATPLKLPAVLWQRLPGTQSAVLSTRVHCWLLRSLLLCSTWPACSDAGNRLAIRPIDLTVSNETGKNIIIQEKEIFSRNLYHCTKRTFKEIVHLIAAQIKQ